MLGQKMHSPEIGAADVDLEYRQLSYPAKIHRAINNQPTNLMLCPKPRSAAS